jgi:hypothetical protein
MTTGPAPKQEFAPLSATPMEVANAPSSRSRRIQQQTVVLLILLCVSAGAIIGMRKLGMRAGIAFGEEGVIDYTPPDSEKARTYERIMGDLHRIQTPLDVALGEFGKSPFMLQQAARTVSTPPPAEDAAARAAAEASRRAAQRLNELREKAGTLRLHGVVAGTQPLARINGETFRIGDRVGGDFRIAKIEGRSVTVTADGHEFVVSLEQVQSGPKAPPMKIGKPRGR